MNYKTIVVHCDGAKTASLRLKVAADLAARFGALLVGVHAKPPFESPVFMENGFDMAPLFEAYQEGAEAEKTAARAAYDKALKSALNTFISGKAFNLQAQGSKDLT